MELVIYFLKLLFSDTLWFGPFLHYYIYIIHISYPCINEDRWEKIRLKYIFAKKNMRFKLQGLFTIQNILENVKQLVKP